jgi:hypothetical protein
VKEDARHHVIRSTSSAIKIRGDASEYASEYDVESDDELMAVASDDELLWPESDDEPLSEDSTKEAAKAAFQRPPGEKQRIREYLAQHVPIPEEQSDVDPKERILSALNYN